MVETAWLTIRRNSDDDVKERELYVSLDGARLGILTYGDLATVPIERGHHELRVHNTISVKKVGFDAAAGQHVQFRTANAPGRAFAYLAFFLGAAMMRTVVEREEDRSGTPPPARPFRF